MKIIKNVFTLSSLCCLLIISLQVKADGMIRHYYVAAEKVLWNYAPSGINKVKQQDGMGVWGETTVYNKYRYIEYSDASYSIKVAQPEWMGILGPQFRGVVGDTLKIHFKNNADKPLSIHPHGVHYTPENDGAYHDGSKNYPGAYVRPGDSYTYTWTMDEDSGPTDFGPSSIVWVYHSHVDSVAEVYDGLIGSIVVTRKGMQRSKNDPRPKDIDVEFTTLYMIFNEEMGAKGGMKHALNGYIFGNLEGLTVAQGARVRWHLIGMGSEMDIHTAHWHGQTVVNYGKRTDVVELLPTSMVSVDMTAKNPGEWLYHCHVLSHIKAGMITKWNVTEH